MAYHAQPDFRKLPLDAKFVVARSFTWEGENLKIGAPIPQIPPRRLRQLYDVRRVTIAPALQSAPGPQKGKPKK